MAAVGIAAAGIGLAAGPALNPPRIPPIAGKAANNTTAKKEHLFAQPQKQDAPSTIVCEIKITVPEGANADEAEVKRVISIMDKAASDQQEASRPQISWLPPIITAAFAEAGVAATCLKAVQPVLVQWEKNLGEAEVTVKHRDKHEEKEITIKGSKDIDLVIKKAEESLRGCGFTH
jgi:hypothetical protein